MLLLAAWAVADQAAFLFSLPLLVTSAHVLLMYMCVDTYVCSRVCLSYFKHVSPPIHALHSVAWIRSALPRRFSLLVTSSRFQARKSYSSGHEGGSHLRGTAPAFCRPGWFELWHLRHRSAAKYSIHKCITTQQCAILLYVLESS